MSYFEFTDVVGKHSIHESVKKMSFDQLKSTFEGKLDYVSLANELGIKQVKGEPKKEPKESKEEK